MNEEGKIQKMAHRILELGSEITDGKIVSIYFHGSRFRKENRAGSDYDFVVIFDGKRKDRGPVVEKLSKEFGIKTSYIPMNLDWLLGENKGGAFGFYPHTYREDLLRGSVRVWGDDLTDKLKKCPKPRPEYVREQALSLINYARNKFGQIKTGELTTVLLSLARFETVIGGGDYPVYNKETVKTYKGIDKKFIEEVAKIKENMQESPDLKKKSQEYFKKFTEEYK